MLEVDQRVGAGAGITPIKATGCWVVIKLDWHNGPASHNNRGPDCAWLKKLALDRCKGRRPGAATNVAAGTTPGCIQTTYGLWSQEKLFALRTNIYKAPNLCYLVGIQTTPKMIEQENAVKK